MIYQIITHEDRYLIISQTDPLYEGAMANARWYRQAPDLVLAGVESDTHVMEDIQGFKHEVEGNFHPRDASEWLYKEYSPPQLTYLRVWEEEVGNYTGIAYYVSDHTFLVEVTTRDTGEVLAKSFPAFYEPRFGVDVADMDNIMQAAESLCIAHESKEAE